jgi:hypothetical protein
MPHAIDAKTTIKPPARRAFVHRTMILTIVMDVHVFRVRESANY